MFSLNVTQVIICCLNTNKNNLELHGFGIKSIKRIAKKYNGFADFYQEKNIFYCVVKLPINH